MRFWHIHPGYLTDLQLLRETTYLRDLIYECEKPASSSFQKAYSSSEQFIHTRYQLVEAERQFRSQRYQQGQKGMHVHNLSSVDLSLGRQSARQLRQLKLPFTRSTGTGYHRITIPSSRQQLWAQHKYSMLARDHERYKSIGRQLSKADMSNLLPLNQLLKELTEILYLKPDKGNLQNTLDHMWGHVSEYGEQTRPDSPEKLLMRIQQLAVQHQAPYLLSSTALTELKLWI